MNTKPWIAGAEFHSRELKTRIIPIAERDCARAVASVFAGFGDGEQVAALIAAAPDLLAACELALVRMEDLACAVPELEAETDRHAATIRAAVDKARGR